MFSKKIKAMSLTLAAVMAFSAVPASAADIDISNPDSVIDVRVNKPYLNFTVSGNGDVDISRMSFALQDSKGNVVAKFRGDSDNFYEDAIGMFDFSDMHSADDMGRYSGLNNAKYLYDTFIIDPLKGKAPTGGIYNDELRSVGSSLNEIYLYEGRDYYYYYTDRNKFEIVETKTIPANTVMVDVSPKYIDINNRKGYLYLSPKSSDDLKSDYDSYHKLTMYDHAGELMMTHADAGSYNVCVVGGIAGDDRCEAYDHPTTYLKVRIKYKDACTNLVTDDLIVKKEHKGTTYDFDLRGDNSVNCFTGVFFSGAAITAPVPDNEGYVELWVSEETLTAYISYDYHVQNGFSGGSAGKISLPKSVEKINNIFEFPQSGYCLYGITPETYTLVVENDRRYVSEEKVVTDNRKSMQTASFTIVEGQLLGDCDHDDDVDINDIAVLSTHVKGIKRLQGRGTKAGDVDEDEKVDVRDVIDLAAHVKGIKKLPDKYV